MCMFTKTIFNHVCVPAMPHSHVPGRPPAPSPTRSLAKFWGVPFPQRNSQDPIQERTMSPCLVLQKENEKSALVSPKHSICLETNVMEDLQPSIILLIPMIKGKKLNMEKTATIDIFRTWARTSEGMHSFSGCDVGLCLCRLCLFALVPGRVQMAIPQWRSPQFHSVPFSRNTVRKKRATEGRLNFFKLLFTLGVPLQCLAVCLQRGLFGHGCRDGFLQKLFCLTITGKILLDISSGQFGEFLFFLSMSQLFHCIL